jgi:hypothetical protein
VESGGNETPAVVLASVPVQVDAAGEVRSREARADTPSVHPPKEEAGDGEAAAYGIPVHPGEGVQIASAQAAIHHDLQMGGKDSKNSTSSPYDRFHLEMVLLFIFLAGMVLLGVFGLARRVGNS